MKHQNPESLTENQDTSDAKRFEKINQNIERILAFYKREEQKLSYPQRFLEYGSDFVARPYFLISILVFVAFWIIANLRAEMFGGNAFDPPPFPWLQGIVSLCALITMTMVLIKQNRIAKLEEQRAHLELQVTLLTEQKISKLITLIEELRHDLPMVKDRHDPESAAYQQPTDPDQVLSALDEKRETNN